MLIKPLIKILYSVFWERDFAIIVSRDWDFSIFLDSAAEKIAELPGANVPGPHHILMILALRLIGVYNG